MAIRQAAMRAVFMLLVAAVQAGAVAAPRGLAKPPDITQSVRRVVRRLGRKMGVLIKSRRATRGAAGQNASNGVKLDCCRVDGTSVDDCTGGGIGCPSGCMRCREARLQAQRAEREAKDARYKEEFELARAKKEKEDDARRMLLCTYREVWDETKVCPTVDAREIGTRKTFVGFKIWEVGASLTAENCPCAEGEKLCESCPDKCKGGEKCETECYSDGNRNPSKLTDIGIPKEGGREPKALGEIGKWGSFAIAPSKIAFVPITEPYAHLKVLGVDGQDEIPNGAEIVTITTEAGHNPKPPCEEDLYNQTKKNDKAAVTFLLPTLPNAAPRVKSTNPVCCACWRGDRMVVGPATIAKGLNKCQCNDGKQFNVPLRGSCSPDVVHWITWSSLSTASTAIATCDKDTKHSWVNILTVQALLMTGQPLKTMMGQNYVIEADEVTQWSFFYDVVKGLARKVVEKLGEEESCLCNMVKFPKPFPGQKRRYVIGDKPYIELDSDTLWNAAKVSITEYKNKDQLFEDYKTDIEGWAKQFKCKP